MTKMTDSTAPAISGHATAPADVSTSPVTTAVSPGADTAANPPADDAIAAAMRLLRDDPDHRVLRRIAETTLPLAPR